MYFQGANSHGQLGLNVVSEQIEKPTKVQIEFYDTEIKQIACGGGHSLLIDEEGRLFSCGWNSKLQLATDKELHTFERTWALSGIQFTNIVCGWDFSCGITDDLLFVWGSNSHGQLGLPKDHFLVQVSPVRLQVKAQVVSMGLRHTAIINSKGEVWVTGCGKFGQLGLGTDVISVDRFTLVNNIGKMSHVACGQKHTVAWSTDENALYVWGDNNHGQLVLNTEKYSKIFTPQKIDIGVKQAVKKLLTGWTNVLLWLDDGTLFTWGRNTYGQIGGNNFVGQKNQIKLPGMYPLTFHSFMYSR